MNFKKYKALSATQKQNEAYYVIGLDVGNDSSAIAFYNLAEGAAETIDLSGGYGKPSIPTVMQYVPETKEWVFGEYAVLNRGDGVTFSSLLRRMGQFDYLDVGGRSLSVAGVFALFVKEILSSVKNINPKAEIVGIVASVPAYFSSDAREEFTRVFKLAGYEKELIALVPDRECVLAHYFRSVPEQEETVLLVDLGNRELRGGLYNVQTSDDAISAVCVSSVFDSEICMAALNADVERLFASFVPDLPPDANEQLAAFSHQHKDLLFQKNIRTKPQKLYFNFVYPPTAHTITHERVEELVAPYSARLDKFLRDVLEKNLLDKAVTASNVDAVLCVGGGFDMLWAKDAVTAVFPSDTSKKRVHFYKNPKVITAEGAALIAAREVGLAGAPLSLEDKHQLTDDIGISTGDNFLTLVPRNGFWWQAHAPKLVLVNSPVEGELEMFVAIQSPSGENRAVSKIILDGLPLRPKGVTRLEIAPNFRSNAELTVKITDRGFGDLFPRTDYEREFMVKI
ncbi:MAG: DUF5716 family protein [Defluviitaleaceae bacterium]|nr:DUF5716 family protein [Defluviitaleaceae bacterium]